VRQQLSIALMLLIMFLLSGHFSSHATHISYSSTHSCASPIPQPVSGSPLPTPSVAGKILINEVLTLPGSSIASHGYLVLFPSTFSGSHIIANLRLLIEGISVDQVEIPTLHVDQSFARVPDGSNSWHITLTPTIDSSNNILPPASVTTPTAALPNQSDSSSNNSSSTPVPATGTQTAWKSLQFPTPVSIETPSSKPTTSYATLSSTPLANAWDTPHRLIITVIILALAITLFWCWRSFTSS